MGFRRKPFETQTPEPASTNRVDIRVPSKTSAADFEKLFLPHLDSAYNLARLLMRNSPDAEDVVQESYLKALGAFSGFRGEATRSWLLTIVRNTCFTWLRDYRQRAGDPEYKEELYESRGLTPEAESLGRERTEAVERCIQRLPSDFREAIVLRELEELSYREISEITGVPSGTVMSRLARARVRLAKCLQGGAGVSVVRPLERS